MRYLSTTYILVLNAKHGDHVLSLIVKEIKHFPRRNMYICIEIKLFALYQLCDNRDALNFVISFSWHTKK